MVFDLQLWLVVCPYHAKSEVLSISSWITLKATRQQCCRDADGFCYFGFEFFKCYEQLVESYLQAHP